MILSNRVILNIRGVKYDVKWKTLRKFPNTRLGKLKNAINTNEIYKLCDDFDSINNEFYFERDPFIFNYVLNYYLTGKLHVSGEKCVSLIKEELNYWDIDVYSIESCCGIYYHTKSNEVDDNMALESATLKKIYFVEDFGKRFYPEFRRKVWNLFEKPRSSIYSKVKILYRNDLRAGAFT